MLLSAWLFSCLLTATSLARAASPESLITHSAYWEDPSGQASLAQAQTQTYTPYNHIFNRGYSDSVHWLRLTLAPSATPVGLRISPTWVDSVTVYDPVLNSPPVTLGDQHPKDASASQALAYTLQLATTDQARDIWLQMRSTSSHILMVQAMPNDQMPSANMRAAILTSLYIGTLVMMLLGLFSIWWVQREEVLGTYLVRHTVFIFYAMGYLGLPALFLPQNWLDTGFFDKAFAFSVVVTLPIVLWFDLTLLATYKPQRHLLQLGRTAMWASLTMTVLLLAGYQRLALQWTVQSLMAASLLVMAIAWSSQPDDKVEQLMPKKVMLSYYTIILITLLAGLLAVSGWTRPASWTLYLLVLHGLMSGVFMTVILFVRGQRQFRQHQQMVWQLHKAQQDADLQNRRRDEQSQFLHMLMHELKTPLSIVSLVLGTRNNREENLGHASRAVQDMKAILDRCVQADQMGELTLQRLLQPVELPTLVRELGQRIPRLHERLEFSGPENLPELQTDRQLLWIVLTNLLDNAMRYSDPLTPVTVQIWTETRDQQTGLGLCVRNIPGMAGWPDETQLFTKYYRSAGAQRDSGSGLGLYLARQLTESLGGTLTYSPNTQQVEFQLWIPLNRT